PMSQSASCVADSSRGPSRPAIPSPTTCGSPCARRRTMIACSPPWRTRRTPRETTVSVSLFLDGAGRTAVATGVGFYDHLLTSLAHHGLFDLDVTASGDLAVDEHHTVEDVAL